MKIRTKLILAFGVVTLMTLGVSLLGFLQTQKLSSALYEIAVVRLPSIQGLNTIREAMLELKWLAGSRPTIPEKALEISQLERNAWNRLQEGWDLYEPLPQTPAEARKWKAFVTAANEWQGNYLAGA